MRETSPNAATNFGGRREARLWAARAVLANETFCNQIRDLKSEHQEIIQPILLAPQAVQETTSAPPTKMSQDQQPVVRVTPWKDVGGVIVIDDD